MTTRFPCNFAHLASACPMAPTVSEAVQNATRYGGAMECPAPLSSLGPRRATHDRKASERTPPEATGCPNARLRPGSFLYRRGRAPVSVLRWVGSGMARTISGRWRCEPGRFKTGSVLSAMDAHFFTSTRAHARSTSRRGSTVIITGRTPPPLGKCLRTPIASPRHRLADVAVRIDARAVY